IFNPKVVQHRPADSFMDYFKISMNFGIGLGPPWIIYQIWAFVATGLYPHERKMVQLFAPASIGLFMLGASFMVVFALSPLLNFLIGVSTWFPLPTDDNPLYRFLRDKPAIVEQATQPAGESRIPILIEDPPAPRDGDLWFNATNERLFLQVGETRYTQPLAKAADKQFVQPFFSVAEYLGFVTNLALAFGLGFQIPLVVIFLIRVGLIPSKQMAAARKYVILGISIAAAILTPSPDVGTMMMLAVPMWLLFEVGLLVGRRVEATKAASASSNDG
ncbi:MAG: preprotein translocase subunit TatC, partial [Phycisphaerales bacterium]|nr:preprotein translocase subunit TatC [Phycisphaerales bacterium]